MKNNYIQTNTPMPEKDEEKQKGSALQHNEAISDYRLGKIYFDKSDLKTAELYFNRSISNWKYPDDINFTFKTLGFLVRIAAETLDEKKTENYILQSEIFLEKSKKWLSHSGELTSEFYYNSGIIFSYRGDLKNALEDFALAAKKAREENSPEVLAKSVYGLANTYFNLKELQLTLKYLDQLKSILEVLGKSYLLGTYHLLYGNVYSELNEYNLSISHYQNAHKVLVDKTCWNLYGKLLLQEGIVYKKMGEFNKALLYFELTKLSINPQTFKKLYLKAENEITDVNGSDIDLVMDRNNRMIYEKNLGPIDFKHRFILLEILYLLVEKPGDFFSKELLAKSIWRDEYNPLVHDKLIYTSVSRLRKLIEPKKNKRCYIIRGQNGYTFNPKIKVRIHIDNEVDKKSNAYGIELSSPV